VSLGSEPGCLDEGHTCKFDYRPMTLIHAQSITKRFGGVYALRGANFSAKANEVHALLGENGAGKSTFIQILTGALRPDSGTLLLKEKPYRPRNPLEGQAAGISAVFQELSLIPDLTIAQNIWFCREPRSFWRTIKTRILRRKTEELLHRYQFPMLRPERLVRSLPLGERQIVEVAKALSRDPDALILDEATSAMPRRETEWLLGLAGRLARSGKLIIFISHRLAEVRAIVDRITVFRNGATVATYEASAVSDDQIIADMLGRRLDRLYPQRLTTAQDRVALDIRGLSCGRRLTNVNLAVHEGEIMGVSGLQGHGQRELFLSLFGANRSEGQIKLWGRQAHIRSPYRALRGTNPVALVPEDRRGQGLLLARSIGENLTLPVMRRVARFGLLNSRREQELCTVISKFLNIKFRGFDQAAGTLSGGNQQKIVFGKMLLTEAKVLLLYDPTRGVDVGTKGEIFQLMRKLARDGYAILFYSSDLSEIANVADRVAVLQSGRVVAILSGEDVAEPVILRSAMAGTSYAD
jgi:ribose transport system ATP-binding protein